MYDDENPPATIVNVSADYCPACKMSGVCWWHQLSNWERKVALMPPEKRRVAKIKTWDAERLVERRDARPVGMKPTSRERQNEAAAARFLART